MGRLVKTCVLIICLIMLAVLIVPKLLSTDYIKQRIGAQLSDITGRAVSLNGNSAVSIYPYLGVTYSDVTIGDVSNEKKPIVTIERLKARLGLLAAFWGEAQIRELHFIRPHFTLTVDKNGDDDWGLKKEPLAHSLSSQGGKQPVPLSLGTLHIEDGIFTLLDERNQTRQALSAIDGTIVWPQITAPAEMDIKAVLGGEIIALEASFAAPYALFKGQSTQASFNWQSDPLKFFYEGDVNVMHRQAKGNLQASTQSLHRLAEWIHSPLQNAEISNALAIDGAVTVRQDKIDFPDAKITIGAHEGNGLVQFENRPNVLSVSGTLAFDAINFGCRALIEKSQKEMNARDLPFTLLMVEGVTLDLRFSAQEAQCGNRYFANLAASVLINENEASFDVGHAEAFKGIVTGALKAKREEKTTHLAAEMNFNGIDLNQLSDLYDREASSIFLDGKGDALFNLKFSGNSLEHLVTKVYGQGHIIGKNGVLSGIDLTLMKASAASKGQQPRLSFSGQTDYQEIKLDFYLANGTAIFHDSSLRHEAMNVELAGQTNLRQNTLALNGKIVPIALEKERAEGPGNALSGKQNLPTVDQDNREDNNMPLFFFIGGTIQTPHVVPLNITPGLFNP